MNSGFFKAALVVLLACPVAVSCYDDSDIRKQLDLLVSKVYDLEQSLNNEIDALKAMLKGGVMIQKTVLNTDGTRTVILTDGTEITLYPKTSLQSCITYMPASVNGKTVNCWAYIDENGTKRYLRDDNDNPIPVESATPEVVEIDGQTYLVIGNMQYPLVGNSVFSDYEVHADELTGEVYAVTFTFGEDMKFTVTVDGACGFYFVNYSGVMGQMQILDEYYIAAGKTERVQISAVGVVDYVLQIPDGWKVKEYVDVYTSEKYFDITAPGAAAVEAGAETEGDIKVVAVIEGGKATISKLHVSSKPFKTFAVSLGKVYVEMNNGLQKYVCGVTPAAEYNEAEILEVATGLLTAFDYPEGYDVLTYGIDGQNVAEVAGKALELGAEYVFWAIPALYYVNGEDAGYTLEAGTFETVEFTYHNAALKVLTEAYKDIVVSLDLAGVDTYYAGLLPEKDYYLIDVLYGLNNGLYTAKSWTYGNAAYEGSVFKLTGVTAEPATDYVLWVAPAEVGKTYTEQDLLVCECSTITLTPGGAINVTASDPQASTLDFVTTLNAEGAEAIYYKYLTASDAKKHADDAARADYLMQSGLSVKSASAVAKLSEAGFKVKPSTSYVLYALAADEDGKYGEVLVMDCATTAIAYNDLVVDVKLVASDPGNVVLNVSSEGATGYLYWIGTTGESTWTSPNYMGGTLETAQSYMYLNSDQYRITYVMEKYPVVDGKIVMTDLKSDKEYLIIIMAKAEDGTYSMATIHYFKQNALAIGEVVLSSDPKWEAAKPIVTWIPEMFQPATGMMYGQFGCMVQIPAGMTGYVLLATDSALCESEVAYEMEVNDKILKVMVEADHMRDSDIPDPAIDPELWPNYLWPDGSLFYHHEHGHPLFGYGIVWASRETHAAVCGGDHEGVKPGNAGGKEVEVTHVLLINDGNPIEFRKPDAVGSVDEVVDKVYIVLQDADGNCYQTYEYGAPVEYFNKQ